MPPPPAALAAVAGRLRCPTCGAPLAPRDVALGCANGHAFDVARGGFVSLLAPAGRVPAGDTAEMVAARAAFLDGGHFAAISAAVVEAATPALADAAAPLVADLGAGTGHHLAAVLEAAPAAHGAALDASRPALRQAARRHPRIAAVRCDVWRELPLQDGAAAVVLDVFAPRHGAEIARVLAPGGALVVVTPTPDHLGELREPLGLVAVDPAKRARLHAELGGLAADRGREVRATMTLARADALALAGMGPTAHHVAAGELARRAAALPDPVAVTASVRVDVFRT